MLENDAKNKSTGVYNKASLSEDDIPAVEDAPPVPAYNHVDNNDITGAGKAASVDGNTTTSFTNPEVVVYADCC